MSRTISSFVRMTMCGLFLLSAMITAHAQFRAGVQGTISDSAGALVPDAKVTLKDPETGKTQETNTSEEGFYRIMGLAPGKYELTVEKAGYKKESLAKRRPSVLKLFRASTSFSRSVKSQRWSRSPTKQSHNWKLRTQTSPKESRLLRLSDCRRSVVILTSWPGSRPEFLAMQDEAQTETPPAYRILPDREARIIRSFRLRTSHKSPPTVNASRRTIFRSTA